MNQRYLRLAHDCGRRARPGAASCDGPHLECGFFSNDKAEVNHAKGTHDSTSVSLTEGRSHAPKRTMHIFKRWLPLGVVVIVIIAAVIWLQQLHLAADIHEKILIGLVFITYLALWMAMPRSPQNR
jgi:hypothetical protein